jgi:hypothetical protein
MTDWIIVSFDGTRDRVMGGKRGGQRRGPAKALGTIAIPIDSIRQQIEAAGYVLKEGLATSSEDRP